MSETDLISRQAAIDAIDKRVQFLKDDPVFRRKHGDIDLYGIKPIIRALPSAQQEIIHCKDCKFWTHIKRTNRYWCKTDDGLYDLNPSPNDFCSSAERRTDGSTD